MSCISRPKQPLGWGSPCHRLHMNSLRYSCYLLTIDQVSTDHRPSVDQLPYRYIGEISTNYRRSVGEVSVNEKGKAISAETHLERPSTVSRLSVVRLSSESRPTIDRYIDRVSTDYRLLYWPSLDWLSTECRPTIDRYIDQVSTDYRPLYRPIDRSTLPTVNKIQNFLVGSWGLVVLQNHLYLF